LLTQVSRSTSAVNDTTRSRLYLPSLDDRPGSASRASRARECKEVSSPWVTDY
jgi:hypothetical protein